MASKFIIFLVLAAVAQNSAAVEYSELEDKLSTIKEAGNATLANFYAVVNGFYNAVIDKLENAGSNGEVIQRDIVDAFQTAYDNTAAGMMPIAKNTAVFAEREVETKTVIKQLVLTTWSLFNVTPASKNLTATLEELEDIKTEVIYQTGNVWNGIFDMALDSIDSEVPEIKIAIEELRSKATAFALETAKVIAAAIEIWVTKFAPGHLQPEEFSNYLERLEILNKLGLASMSAEVNEKFCLFQYIATYYSVLDVDNVNNFTRLMNDEITVTAGLGEAFGEVLWYIDDENDSPVSYDTLEKLIYGGLEAAYYSTWDAILSIRIFDEFEVPSDARIPDLAKRLREAAELAEREITPDVASELDVKKQEIGTLAYYIWEGLYENLGWAAEDIKDAQPAIDSAWTVAAAGMDSAINYLFRALKKENFAAEEGIKYAVGNEISTKFCIIRGLRLVAHLSDSGMEIPLSLVYNDQLGGPSAEEL